MAAIEIKVGSSEGGNKSNPGSHHPVRSGAVRSYKATGHRHLAEVKMVLGCDASIHFAVTAIEMVRGVHLLAHCYLREEMAERDIWRLYRGAIPRRAVRSVGERQGGLASLARAAHRCRNELL